MRKVCVASVSDCYTRTLPRSARAGLAAGLAAILAAGTAAQAQDKTRMAVAPLTLAISMEAANEAIRVCNAKGYRATVSVVDTDGVIKVQARSDNSPIHSLRFSHRKAFTVVSMGPMFGVDTLSAVINFLNTKNPVGLGNAGSGSTDLLFIPGAALIKSGGQAIGSIGVSGALLSSEDETCALAAVAKIQAALDERSH